MNIVNRIRRSPKKFIAAALVAAAVIIPAGLVAANSVLIESDLEVANVTAGDTSYSDSVEACYNDTVKFKVYYHNRELPESGLVANNVSLDIDMPTTPGKVQTVTSTVAGDNTNTVVDTSTVNLCREDAYLEFVPGTVTWRRNVGTNEDVQYKDTILNDRYVTDTGTLLPLENQQPCFNFESIVTYEAKVVVPALTIDKDVKLDDGSKGWHEQVTAEEGDQVKFLLEVTNNGNTPVEDITIQDQLPAGLSYVPDSTTLYSGNHPDGVSISDNQLIVGGGVNIGRLRPGINTIITFLAKVDADHYGCETITNTGLTRGLGLANWVSDTASVEVCNEDEPEPEMVKLSLKKYVNGEDANTNASAVAVESGETVTWKIVVTNGGPDNATGVVVSDAIPNGISDESNINTTRGSYNADTNEWKINNLPANGEAELTFDTEVTRKNNGFIENVATITDVDQEDSDGPENNTDPAVIQIDNPTVSDPEYACEQIFTNVSLLNVNEEVKTTVRAIAEDGASVVSYTYNFGDGSEETVVSSDTENMVTHTYSAAAEYTITATITFDVEGETETRTCSTTVRVDDDPEQPVYECSAIEVMRVDGSDDTYKITVSVTAENGATFKHFVYDFGDGSDELVTDKAMVEHTYNGEGSYKIVVRAVFTVDGEMVNAVCTDEVTVSTEVCDLDPSMAANDPKCTPCEYNDEILASDEDCQEACSTDDELLASDPDCGKPKGVTTLPNTGPGAALVSIFGTGALGVVARGYANSRKSLRESLTR